MVRQVLAKRRRWLVGTTLLAITALLTAGCAHSQRGDKAASGGELVFGLEGQPKLFDPFYAYEGATFTVTHQLFDNLVTFKPGTVELTSDLATNWTISTDGLTYTFQLRPGVKFTDGTEFNADAVCANFTRWYSQTGAGQSEAVSQYWVDYIGGFSDGKKPSLYQSCTAPNQQTAVVRLTRTSSQFLYLLSAAPFSIQSPVAMQTGHANDVQKQGESFSFPPYSNNPVGTGPFKLSKNDVANHIIELVRNDDYWGSKPKLNKIVFKIIGDETVRKQELQSGGIDGYNLPSPADWTTLRNAGFHVMIRPAFNLLYLGINQKNVPALRDLRVRQAIMYAINREQLVNTQLPDGASVADEFVPHDVDGYTENAMKYNYDPAKAKQLLAEAGASNLTVNFYWPSEVSRPYMPYPQDLYTALSNNLKAVGITVNAITKPWNGGYLTDLDHGKADLYLLGWTADNPAAANWVGTFFSDPTNRTGTGYSPWGVPLAEALKQADAEPDSKKRTQEYQVINQKLMSDYLPFVPLAHSPPAIVFKKNVTGFVPSPVTSSEESYASVSVY